MSTFDLSVRFLLQLAAILAVGKVLALFRHDADIAWRAIGGGLLFALFALLVLRHLLAAGLKRRDGAKLTPLL